MYMHLCTCTKNSRMNTCINLQLPIIILKKSVISDTHHGITYMLINFQQSRVSRSVKTVHTNLFKNNRKLHKCATTNSNLEIIDYLRHASSYNVHEYQFSAKSC